MHIDPFRGLEQRKQRLDAENRSDTVMLTVTLFKIWDTIKQFRPHKKGNSKCGQDAQQHRGKPQHNCCHFVFTKMEDLLRRL